ncbi:SCO family protein [Agrobacterium sp. T29]|uniref:SCO family protein n=1 Tax=Agrobacterium sp. T29 TaxID=2580515 RepID=UPI001FED5727|nr:SCO family protein [Agrobacterium sp. T29]
MQPKQMRIVIFVFCLTVGVLSGLIALIVTNTPKMDHMQLGTSFSLTDDRGQPITDAALRGHPTLLFFGFTHCPEVCPTTLYEMSGWFKALGPEADNLKAFFFSVDPERDTPELMHNYTSSFTDRITGVTGDPVEMEKVIKSWKVYAKKVPTEGGDYTMDHTASVFLLDTKGNLEGTISYGSSTETAIAKIRNLLSKSDSLDLAS